MSSMVTGFTFFSFQITPALIAQAIASANSVSASLDVFTVGLARC
jgi:hypothetical protein